MDPARFDRPKTYDLSQYLNAYFLFFAKLRLYHKTIEEA